MSLSLFYLVGHKNAYKTATNRSSSTDVLQEPAAFTHATPHDAGRDQSNRQRGPAIEKNRDATSTTDDVVLKTVNLFLPVEVTVGQQPANIADLPPEPLRPNGCLSFRDVYRQCFTERLYA
jgi:hypothetical protein